MTSSILCYFYRFLSKSFEKEMRENTSKRIILRLSIQGHRGMLEKVGFFYSAKYFTAK